MKKILLLASSIGLAMSMNAQTLNENFDAVTAPALPTSWITLPTVSGQPAAWRTGTNVNLGSSYFPIPSTGTGKAVAVNDDKDSADYSAASLETSTFSLAGIVKPYLNFKAFYLKGQLNQAGTLFEEFKVQISTNGGTSYTDLAMIEGNTINGWEDRFISLLPYLNSTNVKIKFLYNDKGAWAYGVALDDIRVFDAPANDIKLTSVAPASGTSAAYGASGTTKNISGVVFNNGSNAITSYTVKYQQGTSAIQSYNVTGANIAPFTSANFIHNIPFTIPGANTYNFKVWAELTGDANHANDTLNSATVIGTYYTPLKKPLFEEGTGTWCGWCPRGMVYLDSFANSANGSKASLVAVHNSDPMTITAYDNAMGQYISGFPNLVTDRTGTQADPSQIFTKFTSASQNFGGGDITATPSVSGNTATVNFTFKPAADMPAQMKVALIVTEDGVKGTGSGWNQSNYYAGGGSGVMGGWESKSSSVSGVVFDHVARYINNPTGDASILPATMTGNQTYNGTLNATLNASWTGTLHYVVVVFNADGTVANTQNGLLRSAGGTNIKNIASDVNSLELYPNPVNTNNVTVKLDISKSQNSTINITDVLGKVVYSMKSEKLNVGTNYINIPVNTLSNGTYFVNLISEGGNTTTKITVAK